MGIMAEKQNWVFLTSSKALGHKVVVNIILKSWYFQKFCSIADSELKSYNFQNFQNKALEFSGCNFW